MNTNEMKKIEQIAVELHSNVKMNAFTLLSSGVCQLENLHSQVIAQMINPQQRHGCAKAIMQFLMGLVAKKAKFMGNDNVSKKLETALAQKWCDGVRVETEFPASYNGHNGRIDIAILNDGVKQAVIVENKINGAPDMSLQLFRYVSSLEEQGYEVLAVVYLKQFDDNGHPDWSAWTDCQRQKVEKILIPLSACTIKSKYSLESCLQEVAMSHSEIQDVTNQYISFIKGQEGDRKLWNQFFEMVYGNESVVVKDCHNEIVSRYMKLLPEYLERRVLAECAPCEFQKNVYYKRGGWASYQRYDVYIPGCDNRIEFGMDVDLDNKEIRFIVLNDGNGLVNRDNFLKAKTILKKIDKGFLPVRRGGRGAGLQYCLTLDGNVLTSIDILTGYVANVIAKLSDSKDEIVRSLVA